MSIDGIAGRVVLVTGASRQGSIGMAIAETFVRAGAIVVISDIGRPLESFPEYQVAQPDELEQSVQILRGMGPQTVIGIPCDVSSSTEVDALVDRVVGEFGRIDILINNAGIALGLGPVTGVTDDQWHRNLEVM
jgi:NAD(P)-dependent dehydrogenase (short-subunit alcohol dehydrogenase family)